MIFLKQKDGFLGYDANTKIKSKENRIINYIKISSGFFSKPIVSNENIIIIDEKMRILQLN